MNLHYYLIIYSLGDFLIFSLGFSYLSTAFSLSVASAKLTEFSTDLSAAHLLLFAAQKTACPCLVGNYFCLFFLYYYEYFSICSCGCLSFLPLSLPLSLVSVRFWGRVSGDLLICSWDRENSQDTCPPGGSKNKKQKKKQKKKCKL